MAMNTLTSPVRPAKVAEDHATTTRRDMLRLGTSAAAYAAGAAIATGGVAIASEAKGAMGPDAKWQRLCADYKARRDAEAAAAGEEDRRNVLFFRWRDANPAPVAPEPPALDTSRPLRDIIGDCRTPEWEARWSAYEIDLAAWTAANDAKHIEIVGDAEERHTNAMHASDAAFDLIRTYPASSLSVLAAKAAFLRARFGDEMDNEDAQALCRDIQRLASVEG